MYIDMEKIEFKKIIKKILVSSKFIYEKKKFYCEFINGVITIDLIKSNFGNKYDIYIELYGNGIRKEKWNIMEARIQGSIPPMCCLMNVVSYSQYSCLDLEFSMLDDDRKTEVETLLDALISKYISVNSIPDLITLCEESPYMNGYILKMLKAGKGLDV